jgi:hypothetical protein
MRTYVVEFWLPVLRPKVKTMAASDAHWNLNTRRGPYRPTMGGDVGAKAIPRRQ